MKEINAQQAQRFGRSTLETCQRVRREDLQRGVDPQDRETIAWVGQQAASFSTFIAVLARAGKQYDSLVREMKEELVAIVRYFLARAMDPYSDHPPIWA